MNMPGSKVWSSIRSLALFRIFQQSLNQEFRVISARTQTMESGKVFASAEASGANKVSWRI